MTFNNPDTIANILQNKGMLEGSQTVAIYSYMSPENKPQYAVFLSDAQNDIYRSPYVCEPIVLLCEKSQITSDGRKFLKDLAETKRKAVLAKNPPTPQEEVEPGFN